MFANDNNGNILGNNLALGQFGASGFNLQTRLDFSGHRSGIVDPHVNSDLIDSSNKLIHRDLTNNQIPGFNGLQRF